jgi:hypothetical protein
MSRRAIHRLAADRAMLRTGKMISESLHSMDIVNIGIAVVPLGRDRAEPAWAEARRNARNGINGPALRRGHHQ